MNIGTLVVSLGADVTGLNNATKALGTMAQRIRTFGYLASAVITLPMVAAAKASFNMAKDYEFAMQKIVGLTGIAQNVVDEWSAELLRLGPALGKTPKELAEGLYFISSSGIKGAEAMRVLELSAKAAASGLGETKTVADYLTSALNAYRDTGLTAAYATDVLVAGVREGKAEAESFASAVGQLIPIASSLGVSLDQIVGAMAAITLTGSSAASAAVYLKGVFNTLIIAGREGGKALDGIGLSYIDLRKILTTGPTGLINVMQKFRDVQMKLGDEAIKDVLPNIRGMTAYMSVAGKNFQYNTEMMKRVTNAAGSLGAAWAAVADTIKIRYDRAISAANVSLISLGKTVAEVFLPILEKWIKRLDELTKWFDSLTDAQKRHKLSWLAFIAILGPASLLISVFIYTLSGLVSIIRGVIFVLNLLKIVMLANPVTFLISVVTSLAMGYLLLRNRTREVADEQSRLNKLWDEANKMKEEKKSVEERIDVLFALNPRQLEELKGDIETQKILQEDYISRLESYRKTWIENDTGWLAMRKKLTIAEDNLKGWENKKIGERDQVQEMRWADEVTNQQKAMNKYIENRETFISSQLKLAKEEKSALDVWLKQVEEQYKQVNTPLEKAKQTLKEYLEQQEEITGAFDDLAEGEYHITRMTLLLGDAFDVTKAKIELYNNILEILADTTIPLTDKRVQGLLDKLMLLNDITKMKVKKPVLSLDSFRERLAPAWELWGEKKGMMGKDELWEGKWAEQAAAIANYNQQLLNQRGIIGELADNFEAMFKQVGGGFKGMIDAFLDSIKLLLAELAGKAAIFALLWLIDPVGTLTVQALSGLRKFVGAPGYAGGTNYASGGLSLVGEKGPELVNLPRGSQVLPNNMTGAAMQNLQGDVEFRIKDDYLVGILNRRGRRVNSYS